MATESYTIIEYKLRAGTPITIKGGNSVIHAFMAEKITTGLYPCTDNLPKSSEFRGQGGTYLSASFRKTSDVKGTVCTGQIVLKSEFVSEDTLR